MGSIYFRVGSDISKGVEMVQIVKGEWWDTVRSQLEDYEPEKDGTKAYVYGPTHEDALKLITALEGAEKINTTTVRTARGLMVRARWSMAESVRGDAPHMAVFIGVERMSRDFWKKFVIPCVCCRPSVIIAGLPCPNIEEVEMILAKALERAKKNVKNHLDVDAEVLATYPPE